MKRYLFTHKLLLIFAVITLLLSAIVDVAFAFIIKHIVDAAVGDTAQLLNAIALGIVFLLLAFFFSYLRKYAEFRYVRETMISLRQSLFSSHMRQSVVSFNEKNSASYISSLTNDLNLVEMDYFLNLLEIIDNIFIFFLSLGSVFIISYQVTIAILVLSLLPVVFPYIFKRKLRKKKDDYAASLSTFMTVSKDLYAGYEVIKSFNVFPIIRKTFDAENRSVEHAKFSFGIWDAFVSNLSQSSGHLMHLAAIGLGTYFVMSGHLTMGSLLAVLQLMNFIVNPMVQLSKRYSKWQSIQGVCHKLVSSVTEDTDQMPQVSKKFVNTLTLDNIFFAYDDHTEVLKGVSTQFEKGKKYAIVGESGSGKSTIFKLLLNYYSPQKGAIRLDEIDNKDLSDQERYAILSIIQQDVFMFDDSVINNITLYEDFHENEIISALKQVKLYDKIMTLPKGLHEQIHEGGNILSGGEKQRLALARTLIRKTPILLMDEATSALDAHTSHVIEDSLINQSSQTVIAITHKLHAPSLQAYDEILMMQDGRIIAKGSYKELYASSAAFQSLMTIGENDT